jgi:Protein of unknown function (DUF3617)
MNLCKRKSVWGLSAAVLAMPFALHAQGTPLPGKPGLWEMQVNTGGPTGAPSTPAGAPAGTPTLPPEAEARIAALPPAQQAQVRAAMAGAYGGGAGAAGAPKTGGGMTTQACLAPNSTMDSLLSRSQQVGMQCTYSNKVQNAHDASFDISCTGAMGKATGHAAFKWADDEHISSTMHMSITPNAQGSNAQGMPTNMTRDISTTGKFVKADCGDVKPYTPPTAPK